MVVPRIVLYCAKCGMPPEYCEYGPDYETHCLPWLRKAHPDLFETWKGDRRENASRSMSDASAADAQVEDPITESKTIEPWTTEERLRSFYEKYMPEKANTVPSLLEKYAGKEEQLFAALVKKYGPEPEDPYVIARWGRQEEEGDDENGGGHPGEETEEAEGLSGGMSGVSLADDVKKRRGVGARKSSKVDTRVIIQKITRNKKKAVTHVVGLDTVPDLVLKDAAKAFSKTFAGSSSVKDTEQGKEIIIQGDHQDTCAEMIVKKFKVPASVVFLDIDGEFVPFG
jgi:density-regulated protein DRP1